MGKAAILIIAASLALGSMYAFGAKEEVRRAEGRLSNHQFEVLARNAALAGYDRVKQALAEDFATVPTNLSGSYEEGKYDVTVTMNGNSAHLVSKGEAGGTEYTVDAVIEKQTIVKMAEEAPAFMSYAVISDDDLSLNGNILTDLYVEGSFDNTLNANMHTNGSLHVSGNAATIRGFGTYVGSATSNPSKALENAFAPYYNPTNDTVTDRVPHIEIPDFDVSGFTSKVSVNKSSTGLVTLSGNVALGGTRENPYVWYINGDLAATGGTTIQGYAMFIVDGNITLAGNVNGSQSSYDGDESNVAFYASGNVNIAGNAQVYGQIYAEDVTFLHGTPRIFGSVTSRGTVTLSGTPKIYYRLASPALTTIFEDGITQLALVSYSEF